MSSKISVLFTVYNESSEILSAAIESILAQTYKNFELIIVLDNPENHKASQLISFFQNMDERIIKIVNEKNMGLVKSLNVAFEHATGEYIARMDADDISHSERFEKQKKYLEENNIDFLGTWAKIFSDSGEMGYYKKPASKRGNYFYLRYGCGSSLIHPTWFFKREVFESLEGYNEVPAAEDYDFLLRALNHGFDIQNLNEYLLAVRIREDGISKSQAFNQFVSSQFCKKKITQNKAITYDECRAKLLKYEHQIVKSKVNISKIRSHKEHKQYGFMVLSVFKMFLQSPLFFMNKIKNQITLSIANLL